MPEEKDKKLEYLKRGEIRTMQKDIAKLRETEAGQEREKVSQIKTAEEIQREKEREARAQEATRERNLAEEEARKKEEEIKRLRETREEKEKELKTEEVKREETKAEGFKGVLKEAQAKEEEERKRFLERVEAKAEGKEVPATPTPAAPVPPPPLPEKPSEKPEKPKPLSILKKIPKPVLRRPSFAQKLWIRIVLTLLVLAIIGAIATFWYWYLKVKEAPVVEETTEEVAEEVEELIIPAALISTENSQTLELSLLDQILKQEMAENQFTRLIIKDLEENKALGLKEFFKAFEVKTPATFYNKVGDDFTLFIYSSQRANRLGFVAEVKEPDLLYLLKYWESSMEADLEGLAVFLGKTGPSFVPYFREVAYKNTAFRYLSFPPQNFGICWAIVNDYFILTFSGESIIKTIDKINE